MRGGKDFLAGSGLLLDVGERRGRGRRAEHGVELGLDLVVRWFLCGHQMSDARVCVCSMAFMFFRRRRFQGRNSLSEIGTALSAATG